MIKISGRQGGFGGFPPDDKKNWKKKIFFKFYDLNAVYIYIPYIHCFYTVFNWKILNLIKLNNIN